MVGVHKGINSCQMLLSIEIYWVIIKIWLVGLDGISCRHEKDWVLRGSKGAKLL